MSTCPSHELDADFVREMFCRVLTEDEVTRILLLWEPFREDIANILSGYWDRVDELSWRDYRNTSFDFLPDPFHADGEHSSTPVEDSAASNASTFALVPDGCHAGQQPGAPGDRGCVCCGKPGGEIIYDARGRYWHLTCAAKTLSEHTRINETRGSAYHYTWGHKPPSSASES